MLPAPTADRFTDAGSFLTTFSPYTTFHLVSVCVALAAVATFLLIAWRLRKTGHEPLVRGLLAGVCLTTETFASLYWLEPERFNPVSTLPLQMCDLTLFLASVALLFPRLRVLTTILFFWGIGLTTQAYATPTLVVGVRDINYWFFWGCHALILIASLYVFLIGGYRPKARDFVRLVVLDIVILGAVFTLDALMGWNYFFVGNVQLDVKTVLDVLGPWPWRVPLMFLIAHAGMLAQFGIARVFARLLDGHPSGPDLGDAGS